MQNIESEKHRRIWSWFSRDKRERTAGAVFITASVLPLILVVLIIIALYLRARPILEVDSLWNLLSGQEWRPIQSKFGFYPFIIGTIWVTLVAMLLAVPICLLSALYLSEYAKPATRAIMKPMLDLLAAIPSVVYGVWGLIMIVPFVQKYASPILGKYLGFIPLFSSKNPTGYSVLAGGIVLAVMVIPFILAVTFEVLQAIPNGLREASLAIGATTWQTIKHAVMPEAKVGIFAGIVLGSSRALGETMAVLMVVGNVVKVPQSIFDPAYPLPALIANNFGEMLSIPMYDAALMGAALFLLVVILLFNIASTAILQRMLSKTRRAK